MKYQWIDFKRKYWDIRSRQEQVTLKWAAWILAPVLVYFVLWQPAQTAVGKLQGRIPKLYLQADRLRSQASEIEMLRHRPKPAVLDAVALKSTIEDSARRYRLRDAISTLDLQEPNAVRLTFAAVSFEDWLSWMRALQFEQHIRADSASVAMLPQAGMVKISVTLINGGSP